MEAGEATVKVTADTTDAVRSLKQLERQARQTARAIAELREVIADSGAREYLASKGLAVVFVDKPKAESEEGQSHE